MDLYYHTENEKGECLREVEEERRERSGDARNGRRGAQRCRSQRRWEQLATVEEHHVVRRSHKQLSYKTQRHSEHVYAAQFEA